MAILDWVVKAIGFESKDENSYYTKENRTKTSFVDVKENDYSNFLNKTKSTKKIGQTNLSNVVVHSPREQEDICKIVGYLQKGEPCIVDLKHIQKKDFLRILDYMSGAVFALKGEVNRLEGDLFLLTPASVIVKTGV